MTHLSPELGPRKGDEWKPSFISEEMEIQLNYAFDIIAKYRRPFVINQFSIFHPITNTDVMEKVPEDNTSVLERKQIVEDCHSLLLDVNVEKHETEGMNEFLSQLLENHCDIPYAENEQLANGWVPILEEKNMSFIHD